VLGAGVVHGLCIAALLPLLVVLPDPDPTEDVAARGGTGTASANRSPAQAGRVESGHLRDPITTASIAVPSVGEEEGKGAATPHLPEPVPAHFVSEPDELVELASLRTTADAIAPSVARETVEARPPVEVLTAQEAPEIESTGMVLESGEEAATLKASEDAAAGEDLSSAENDPAEVAKVEPAPEPSPDESTKSTAVRQDEQDESAPAAGGVVPKVKAAKAPAPKVRAAAKPRKPVTKARAIAPRTAAASARRPVAQQPRPGVGRGPFSFLFGKPAPARQQNAARR
jgi:hypothetical protein